MEIVDVDFARRRVAISLREEGVHRVLYPRALALLVAENYL